jgi:hypothetical protein
MQDYSLKQLLCANQKHVSDIYKYIVTHHHAEHVVDL